jgi:hypothetical protein
MLMSTTMPIARSNLLALDTLLRQRLPNPFNLESKIGKGVIAIQLKGIDQPNPSCATNRIPLEVDAIAIIHRHTAITTIEQLLDVLQEHRVRRRPLRRGHEAQIKRPARPVLPGDGVGVSQG